MTKTISCTQCERTGTVFINQAGDVVDAPLFEPLLERVPCDDCGGSGYVEDEDAEYRFEELDDRAKERAREWFRGLDSSDDYDCVIGDAVRMAEMMGIEISTRAWRNSYGFIGHTPDIYWSGFSSQGDGASFEGCYRYKPGALKAVMAEAAASYKDAAGVVVEQKQNKRLHQIARDLQQAQRAHFYQIVTRVTTTGTYCHENTMRFEHERADGKDYGYGGDSHAWERATDAIEETLKDFARWIYAQLESEYDYHNSDECVDDTIICDYTFNAEGDRV